MVSVSRTLLERRLDKNPDYDLEVWIRGVTIGKTGMVHWDVTWAGEDDCDLVAGMLERAAEVLREK